MNLVHQLTNVVSRERKQIVVIGDALTDVWIHGRAEKCQDDCMKFCEDSCVTTLGGAANATHCLNNWDVKVRLYAWGITDRPIKTRFVDQHGKIVFRSDDEERYIIANENRYEWAHEAALEAVNLADGVLLSDYDKGFLTPELIRQVIDACSIRGVPVVSDAKRDPKTYAGTYLKCNVDYARRWCHTADVCTDGPLSPFVGTWRLPLILPPVNCVNHVGAGDCFAAHLTLALACGFSLEDAATVAHSAGRVYVQHEHNRPPQPEEIAADAGMCR